MINKEQKIKRGTQKNLLILLFLCTTSASAQNVISLVPGISIDSILTVHSGATKIAMEPISGHLFYTTANGDIYEVYIPHSGKANDTLRYTFADHGISFLQGLYFKDSTLYLCGNIWSTTTGIGKIVKGTLLPNGTRSWVDIVTTAPYPTASTTGDHGFAGIHLDPGGNNMYVSSGARTHLGEVRTNGGVWPLLREVPLTTKIYKFPVASVGIVLPNDSSFIENSGYVFAWGIRNAYDMAWTNDDRLFAIDNSGERDDPEELNWLRQGKHYGYPWRMGGNNNPLRVSPYDVNADPLVNHLSGGYLSGWFANDTAFPPAPAGVTFTEPVRNYGTVADFYRDSITGKVKNASDEGSWISSFTSHRSPLGLVFDKNNVLAEPFRGKGFVLSFMPGGDSNGYTPLSPWGIPCPFVDSSRELVQLNLTYNSAIDNYTMTTSNIATGFYLPVDAELINNTLYVIENAGKIWRITFPLFNGIKEVRLKTESSVYPNPFDQNTIIKFDNSNNNNYSLNLYNQYGQLVKNVPNITTGEIELKRDNMESGLYFFQLETTDEIRATGKFIIR